MVQRREPSLWSKTALDHTAPPGTLAKHRLRDPAAIPTAVKLTPFIGTCPPPAEAERWEAREATAVSLTQKLARATGSPLWPLAALITLVLAIGVNDWDVFSTVARFDRVHEGWYIDELATGAVAAAVMWSLRWRLRLKREIARRRVAEADAIALARHDPLTGLPNRRSLLAELRERMHSLRPGSSFATMILDLDHFKAVNDVYGQAAGDELLGCMIARVSKALPERSFFARLGGDRFAVVLPADRERDEVARTADRVVACAGEVFCIQNRIIEVGASIGIALALADGCDASMVLRAADIALHRAKDAGRGTWQFFEAGMDRAMREQAELKSELRAAIVQRQIVPYYQPTVDLATRMVNGFEVLARWRHPTRGLLQPDKFIPLAEDMHLITPLTLALLEQVCIDGKAWPEDYRIAFNVSPNQLQHRESIVQICAAIARSGISPSCFEVEVTENALSKDAERTSDNLGLLRDMGVGLVLDDFGTGYSSLSQLRDIAFDKVKIDQSFVRGIADDPRAAIYVEAIVRLGISLHLQVTAEGIEDGPALERLAELGCSFGQGYLLAEPMPAAELAGFLTRQTGPQAEPAPAAAGSRAGDVLAMAPATGDLWLAAAA